MGNFDFDSIIDRHGTGAIKVDGLTEFFGRDDLQGMWIADMDFCVAPKIQEILVNRMRHPIYGYNVVPEEYWKSITDWLMRRHGWSVDRKDMTYIPGVVKGIGYAVNYFTEKNDKIVIQPPVYHPFKMVIEGNGRTLVNNPLIPVDNGYRMDLEGLERIFRDEHPRMMILCNPHNPVGIQWDKDTLRRVASLAFASVSDEAAKVAVTLGAPSKTFNIAGLVSSWCVIKDEALREGFFRWLQVNEFDAPTFVAIYGTIAAYNYGEEWLDEMLGYIEGNLDEVEKVLAEELPEIKMIRPEASFLVWLDCRNLGLSHSQLIDLFVNKAHLALNDGVMFGEQGAGFMRLNVGCPRHVLRESVMSLAEALRPAMA